MSGQMANRAKHSEADKAQLVALVLEEGMTAPAAIEKAKSTIPVQTLREWVARARLDQDTTGDLERDAEIKAREAVELALFEIELIKLRQAEGEHVARQITNASVALKHARQGLEAFKPKPVKDTPSTPSGSGEQKGTGPSELERSIQATANGTQDTPKIPKPDSEDTTAMGVL